MTSPLSQQLQQFPRDLVAVDRIHQLCTFVWRSFYDVSRLTLACLGSYLRRSWCKVNNPVRMETELTPLLGRRLSNWWWWSGNYVFPFSPLLFCDQMQFNSLPRTFWWSPQQVLKARINVMDFKTCWGLGIV